MYLFYNKLVNYLLVSIILLLFNSCSVEEKNNINESKCFCDSTFFKKNKPFVKEFLCYKKNKCYKLVVNGNSYKLTEHYLLNPNFSYQRIVIDNDYIIDSISSCLVSTKFDKLITIKYVGPKVDSLNVYFLNSDNSRRVIIKVLRNEFNMPFKNLDNDSSIVIVDVFFTRYLEFEGRKGNVLTQRTLEFSSLKDLKENSFDKNLTEIMDCMKSKQTDTSDTE